MLAVRRAVQGCEWLLLAARSPKLVDAPDSGEPVAIEGCPIIWDDTRKVPPPGVVVAWP